MLNTEIQVQKVCETYSWLVILDKKIPSTNYMYHPRKIGKFLGLYKDTRIKKFQEEFIEKSQHILLPNFTMEIMFDISLEFYIKDSPKMFWRRDTDNMLKATVDALKEILQIDDGYFVKISAKKYPTSQKKEAIKVDIKIKEKKLEEQYYIE